jgi:hypothetical protein
MRFKPGQRTSHSLCPVDLTGIIVHKALDLAVIEDNTVGFIADQTPGMGINAIRSDEMIRFGQAGCTLEGGSVPGEDFTM